MAKPMTQNSTISKEAKKVAGKAKVAADHVSEAVADATVAANESARESAEKITDTVSNAFGKQTENVSSFGQKQARKYILNAGRALESAGNQLREDGMGDTAEYIQEAADRLLDAAVSIDSFDPSSARHKAETFLQERPMLTIGGLALLGFAAATFISRSTK